MSKKTIAIVTTGGTIAARHPNQTHLGDYVVEQSAHDLIAAVPELTDLATLMLHEVSHIDSRDMSFAVQHRLIQTVQQLVDQDTVDGVVITHGTDTLEETALLLHWCIKSPKPVVVTGAMRPASALSADGPLNLYHAVLTACTEAAQGLGTLVLMNDQIFSARFVQKTHTSMPDAFGAPAAGALGLVSQGRVYIHHAPRPAFGKACALQLPATPHLPRVDLIYDYVDAPLALYQAAVDTGAQALVIAAVGNGSLSPSARAGALYAAEKGVLCVRASRIPNGPVAPSEQDKRYHTLPAYQFSALAARSLCALALAQSADRQQIHHYLQHY